MRAPETREDFLDVGRPERMEDLDETAGNRAPGLCLTRLVVRNPGQRPVIEPANMRTTARDFIATLIVVLPCLIVPRLHTGGGCTRERQLSDEVGNLRIECAVGGVN